MNTQLTEFFRHFRPRLFTALAHGYSWKKLGQDSLAGVIVGIVALPLAIAFAIASGVKPEQGLYTAIVAGFLISALGGSSVQIGGPTGAFVVIIYGIVSKWGYDGLAVATLLAGVMLVGMGLARLGSLVKFVPYPLTVGFTTGIAVIIAVTQVRDLFGLTMTTVPALFLPKIMAFAKAMPTINHSALTIGLTALVLCIFWPRITRRIPGSLVAIVCTTVLVQWFALPVETIGSRFGEVPSGLPTWRMPNVSFSLFVEMFNPALSIALLAALESLLSAVVADGMIQKRHNSDMEIVAQGIANIASPLFGGIPATGAIARTATNIKNGATTPVAGIVHALTLVLIVVFLGKWASLIPMPTLAAILLVVAWNMSELHLFVKLFRAPTADVLVMLASFFLTVFIDLTVAIEVGFVASTALFMKRMAEVTEVRYITQMLEAPEKEEGDGKVRRLPAGVEVFEIQGSFFFGAVEKFRTALAESRARPQVLILLLQDALSLDATGLKALEDVLDKCLRENTKLLMAGVHAQPMAALVRSGFWDRLGEERFFDNLDAAIDSLSPDSIMCPKSFDP